MGNLLDTVTGRSALRAEKERAEVRAVAAEAEVAAGGLAALMTTMKSPVST